MDKIIFHLDLNYFFCRCEEIINPQLSHQPFIVSERCQRSVVSTSNPKARVLGIRAAMPLKQALNIAPNLIIVNNHRDLYIKKSNEFFACLRHYFTPAIEIMSIDECYLDATDLIQQYHNNYKMLAQAMIDKVYRETKLFVTIGIGNNKIQAKMAGDTKPPNGMCTMFSDEIQTKLWPLSIDKLFMVGKKTALYLNQLGIYKIQDFINYPHQEALKQALKKHYHTINAYAHGQSDDHIITTTRDNKSLSHTHTFNTNTNNKVEILAVLKTMVKSLQQQLENHQWMTNTIMLNIKYDYTNSHGKSLALKQYTNDAQVLLNHFTNLFETQWDQETSIRAISVNAQHLIASKQVVEQTKLEW